MGVRHASALTNTYSLHEIRILNQNWKVIPGLCALEAD